MSAKNRNADLIYFVRIACIALDFLGVLRIPRQANVNGMALGSLPQRGQGRKGLMRESGGGAMGPGGRVCLHQGLAGLIGYPFFWISVYRDGIAIVY